MKIAHLEQNTYARPPKCKIDLSIAARRADFLEIFFGGRLIAPEFVLISPRDVYRQQI